MAAFERRDEVEPMGPDSDEDPRITAVFCVSPGSAAQLTAGHLVWCLSQMWVRQKSHLEINNILSEVVINLIGLSKIYF